MVANLRSLLQPGYTRTPFSAGCFEKHIYRASRRILARSRWLNECKSSERCFFELQSQGRQLVAVAKAPILLLNARRLTGHNWQFAVSWIVEPPLRGQFIDRPQRYLATHVHWRHRWPPACDAQDKPLRASACVPRLSTPSSSGALTPSARFGWSMAAHHDNQGM